MSFTRIFQSFHPVIHLAAAVSMLLLCQTATAQSYSPKDKAYFQENPPSYFREVILPSLHGPDAEKKERRYFKVDLRDEELPTEPKTYTQIWHNKPVSQGQTNTCWCYATTSFYESEVHRLSGKKVRLSEMYTVYWEYVERAKYFVENKGEMFFGEGSETNAVGRMMAKYGTVPYSAYPGKPADQEFHTHEAMFEELKAYMESVAEYKLWDKDKVVNEVKAIMHRHMGEPPTSVEFGGRELSAQQYLKEVLGLKMDEYVHFMSLVEHPYFQKAEYEVPDNWWHSRDYNNVPLNRFMDALKNALENGFTVAIGGDVSGAGLVSNMGVGVIPTFDIPSDYIDENARQLRFNNGATTDDHAMHVVGYREFQGATWFLVKDSGGGSRNCGKDCPGFGYYFFHEDYVKLKMMNITLHRDAVSKLLSEMKDS